MQYAVHVQRATAIIDARMTKSAHKYFIMAIFDHIALNVYLRTNLLRFEDNKHARQATSKIISRPSRAPEMRHIQCVKTSQLLGNRDRPVFCTVLYLASKVQ